MKNYNLLTAPKSDSFRFRINPELRQEAETVYAKCGLTLTDALNVFLAQSINAGGFPFLVSDENVEFVRAKALAQLMKELKASEDSGEGVDEADVYKQLGITQ